MDLSNNRFPLRLFLFSFRLLILFLPLVFVPSLFNPYEFPKFIFFSVTVGALALLWIPSWFLGRGKKATFHKMDFGIFLVLGFGIINLIADLLGINPTVSLLGSYFRHQGFLMLISGIIIFLILHFSPSFKQTELIFRKTILISAILVSVFALWQMFQLRILHIFAPNYNGRIVGTFGNPNFLGGYLVMILPFVLGYKQKNIKELARKIIIIFSIILALFLTDSIASILVLIFTISVYIVRSFFKLNSLKIFFGFILFLGLLGLTYFNTGKNIGFQPPPTVRERGCPESWPMFYPGKILTDIYRSNMFHFDRQALCDNRLLIWTVGMEAFAKRPVLGYGQENFGLAVPSGKMHFTDNAHNIFLETAVSSGIVGLLFYIAIIVFYLNKAPFEIKISLISFLIIAQFNPLSIAQIGLFWMLLGFSKKRY